jgi:hypothetical protein
VEVEVETRDARAKCGSSINLPANDGISSSLIRAAGSNTQHPMAPKRKSTRQQQNIEPPRTRARMRGAPSSPCQRTRDTQNVNSSASRASSTLATPPRSRSRERTTPVRSRSRSPAPRQEQPTPFRSNSLPASHRGSETVDGSEEPELGAARQTTSRFWNYFDKKELGQRRNRRGATVIERAGKCRLCRQMGLR